MKKNNVIFQTTGRLATRIFRRIGIHKITDTIKEGRLLLIFGMRFIIIAGVCWHKVKSSLENDDGEERIYSKDKCSQTEGDPFVYCDFYNYETDDDSFSVSDIDEKVSIFMEVVQGFIQ